MSNKAYEWKFSNVGGVTRVSIEDGGDIAHLSELDQKMWTVLSCPVEGLEIDEKTLRLMDSDRDGKIRVNEVVETSRWLSKVLSNMDVLLLSEDKLLLSCFNRRDEEGEKLYQSACRILKNLGVEKDYISISDTADSMAVFSKTKFNGDGVITENSTDDENLKKIISNCKKTAGSLTDRSGEDGVNADLLEKFYKYCQNYYEWNCQSLENENILPYGEKTPFAFEAFSALKDKIDDYFMRCKFVAFDKDAFSSLDVIMSGLEAKSCKNIHQCIDEIAACPIAHIGKKAQLPLKDGINPSWEKQFSVLKTSVFDIDYPNADSINEFEWKSICDKFLVYNSWVSSKKGNEVESLGWDEIKSIVENNCFDKLKALIDKDLALESESNAIKTVEKLLYFNRDFYTLIKNFVTFSDFYSKDGNKKAVFQAGTLYIDQRSCDLCLKVSDMSKHNVMAAESGMYLVYCDCFSKQKNSKMTIVAAITGGNVDNLTIGKNAIFYDRNGLDWDATVVKIVDNPISVKNAFWSPYRKFGRFISEKINKFAVEQDNKVVSSAISKIEDAETDMTTEAKQQLAEGGTGVKVNQVVKARGSQPFDIAKFCGIFAAIGMAIGYIGGFLVSCVTFFVSLKVWQMPLAILAIMLVISGPSILLAALKLRRRNLSPLLNANGWAVNAQAYVSIPLGATLTKLASFPALAIKDPFAKKKMPKWKKNLIIVSIFITVAAVLYFTIFRRLLA